MRTIRLGRTNLEVSGVSFGALPIQRVPLGEAVQILRRAYDAEVNYFDTARAYSDSEEKIGAALAPVRAKIIISTKTKGANSEEIRKDLEQSLKTLRTDYVDILQIHNPTSVPKPEDGTGRYEALVKARQEGKIRFIGLTNHSVDRAFEAAESGLYDTIQYPFSVLSVEREIALADRCAELDLGFIAMKALCGGLIRHIPSTYAFIRRHANVVPIWGIQKIEELEEFLALEEAPPAWNASMQAEVDAEKIALGKNFCRGCGYCLPCPANIPIPVLARMILLLGRSPWQSHVTPQIQEKMAHAEQCINCGACKKRCPYELDTPALVRENYAFYRAFIAEKEAQGLI